MQRVTKRKADLANLLELLFFYPVLHFMPIEIVFGRLPVASAYDV